MRWGRIVGNLYHRPHRLRIGERHVYLTQKVGGTECYAWVESKENKGSGWVLQGERRDIFSFLTKLKQAVEQ